MKHKHCPKNRGIDVALRRNSGNTSTRQVAIWCHELNLNKNSVVQWEVKACTALLAEARNFHEEHEAQFVRNACSEAANIPGSLSWHYALHTFRCDATNVANRENKWETLETKSLYVHASEEPLGDNVSQQALSVWPEIVPVHEGTGDECFRITCRQLNQVSSPALEHDDSLAGVGRYCSVVRTTVCTTDGGLDQKLMRSKCALLLRDRPRHIWFELDCFKHHCSNAAKAFIVIADHYSKNTWLGA